MAERLCHHAFLPEDFTPLVTVKLIVGGLPRTMLLKLESYNPHGSIKDRTALALWQDVADTVDPAIGIIESTSGNLGLALASIANSWGVPFTAVVDPRSSTSLVNEIRRLGAQVVMVDRPDDAGGYLLSRLMYVREQLRDRPGLVSPNQYENPANPRAHMDGTAPELWAQTRRPATVLVAVSTGGTLAGFHRFMVETNLPWEVIGVDVTGSVAVGGTPGRRVLSGIGASRPSAFLPDGFGPIIRITPDEAVSACLWLFEVSGVDVGSSSGALVAAALRLFRAAPARSVIACVCPDGGERYLDTVYSPAWRAEQGLLPADVAAEVEVAAVSPIPEKRRQAHEPR